MMVDLDPIQRERAVHERRLWVRLTRACNNRCLFCLDADVQDGQMRDLSELKEEIRSGSQDGCARLILSGGEPSLHPDYLELVAFGRLAGYEWIQSITNGRMFAYRSFAEQAVVAGLREATCSMHGHTPELHDRLVAVKGAFEQSLEGIAHLQDLGAVVNVDVVINALNIQFLPDILGFFIGRGISEFDLLWMVPFGRAWKNRSELFCDHEKAAPFLQQALDQARKAKVVIWTNRLPPNLLEGFEEFIQDPHKLHDEVRGRRSEFASRLRTGNPLICQENERCSYCYIRGFCEAFEKTGQPASTAVSVFASDPGELDVLLQNTEGEIEILINRETERWIAEHASTLIARAGRVVVALETFMTLSETEQKGANPQEALRPLRGAGVRLLNLPACVLPDAETLVEDRADRPGADDLEGLTNHFILHDYRVFSLRCSACSARQDCPGMPINHIRCYGFGVLNPLGAP